MVDVTYYNEIDPFAAAWLRNLISAGHIADGVVDDRDIRDVRHADLAGYQRAHFFAGIAGWDLALQLAGWPDDQPVWTGSCPCQPFSAAGRRHGVEDERHLWPVWFELIRECRPPIVFGEQVAAAIRHGWLDLVFSDLEGIGYACRAAIAPACSVGAPHIRERLWWVACTDSHGADCGDGGMGGTERLGAGRDARAGAEAQGGHPCGQSVTVLDHQVQMLTGWATPAARDWRDGRASPETMERNARPLNEQAVGLISSGCPAATEKRGQLDPAFSLWLMGYPDEWLWCVPESKPRPRFRRRALSAAPERFDAQATPSSRKSRPRSS